MKLLLLLCLIMVDSGSARAAAGSPPDQVQAFSAVVWTTTTLHSRLGKPTTFMQRTVYTRDISGNLRREVYRPIKGFEHDTSAPLERVIRGSSFGQSAPPIMHSSKELTKQEVDLGTATISGVAASGKRQVFHDANGQPTRTSETWFSPTLGLMVHTQSSNSRGDTVTSDLSELSFHRVPPDYASNSKDVPALAGTAVPLLTLYRSLFAHVAHMERERLRNDPNRHVDFAEIEDHLRVKIGLSPGEWQVLTKKSMKADDYRAELSRKARLFAEKNRATRQDNQLDTQAIASGRATLHGMQLELNSRVQSDVDDLQQSLGHDTIVRIQDYLQGSFSKSISRMQFSPAQMQAARSRRGDSN